jgi:hypothetical protein
MSPDILGRSRFAALVEDLEWPTIVLGQVVVCGRPSWRRVLARATPPERLTALKALPLLQATAYGRRRFATWQGVNRLPALAAGRLEASLRERVAFYGDSALLPVVVAALALAPAPVRESALAEVAFVAVGVDSVAWTGAAAFGDRDGRRKLRVVVLGPNADVRIVLHELGHTWNAPVDDGHVAVTAGGEAAVLELARVEGWSDRVELLSAKSERLADACAQAWR